jgi:hypothetical protein
MNASSLASAEAVAASLCQQLEISPKELAAVGPLLQTMQTAKIMEQLEEEDLMTLLNSVLSSADALPTTEVLKLLREFFARIEVEQVQLVYDQVASVPHVDKSKKLASVVQLRPEYAGLHLPLLRTFSTLRIDAVQRVRVVVRALEPVQMETLVRLQQMDDFSVAHLHEFLASVGITTPEEGDTEAAEARARARRRTVGRALSLSSLPGATKPTLVSVTQEPAPVAVYRRNVRPAPSIHVLNRTALQREGQLQVDVTCHRSDTMEPLSDTEFIGGGSVDVSPGQVIAFENLKVLVTSHLTNDTAFVFIFHLRRKQDDGKGKVIASAQTSPFSSVSHANQLMPSSTAVATVNDVVPSVGSIKGGTRVAVLGKGFVNGPAIRVRFGDSDVMPLVHGKGTLLCFAPRNITGGRVEVRVSNNGSSWSDTGVSFEYDAEEE